MPVFENVRKRLIEAITYSVQRELCVAHPDKRSLRCPTQGEALAIAHAAIRPVEAFINIYNEMMELKIEKTQLENKLEINSKQFWESARNSDCSSAPGGCVSTNQKSETPTLLEAVRKLYYSAAWSSDRLPEAEEQKLWTAVRDAAGFEPGNSPKPIEVREDV